MAIDDLLHHLEREAEARAAEIRNDAERERAEIRSRAARERARRRMAAQARLDAELASEVRRDLARVERDARRRVLVARVRLVDRIVESAAARLEALPVERYRDRLPMLVAETLGYLGSTPARIACPRDAGPEVAHLLDGSRATLDPEAAATAGVVGRSADGAVTVDNTFVTRLHRDRAEHAIALVAALGGSWDAPR